MTEKAYFAGGCFWCTEAIFQRLKGVARVTSGYAGGASQAPTYEAVSEGGSGHAETVEVEFDPSLIPYEKLVEVFFATHDPTSTNRQGADVGTQYRSEIFVADEEQRNIATSVKARLERDKVFGKPIVTAITPFSSFTRAEDYHQDFYNSNPEQPYCQAVINPKLAKLRKGFAEWMKE
ncbi:MAG: peptide-methionine (S)-S-oxide reductase MsrA [Candidatus Kerfeldbacteria bacterium]|nr:peptide-methionine (S)-S-oxide reductase MsrA [Candidatus Kerfeldbacteria bacterium]